MIDQPHKEPEPGRTAFGKRSGTAAPTGAGERPPRMMRSATIGLVLLGTGALALCAIPSAQQCRQDDPNRARNCSSSSHGGSGGGGGGGRSSSSTSTVGETSHTVSRGGFGGAAHSLFGGGG